MSSIKALMLLSAAGLATAQTTVMDMFLPGSEGENFEASVVSAMTKPPKIEYFVTFAPNAEECGLGPGATVIMAPGSYAFGLNEPPAFTMSVNCEVEHSTGVCTKMVGGSEANDPGTETETMTDFKSEDFFMPVTVTGGLEKLAAFTDGSAACQPAPTAAASSPPLDLDPPALLPRRPRPTAAGSAD
ncbi:GPI anchored cell wall protein [Apiospora aurea]|uniref:GPI anchored cell wall protein n=1 Tax=Apiospora aurea TaxID=335848 RepID=A0ABR1QA87_9PEZI